MILTSLFQNCGKQTKKGYGETMNNKNLNSIFDLIIYSNSNKLIYDMGIKEDNEKEPAFYILTESGEHIQVKIIDSKSIYMVNDFLADLNTGLKIEFKDYGQYDKLIKKVFSIYCDRIGLCIAYDNKFLIQELEDLHVTQTHVARTADVGISTLNDLLSGETQRPRFRTVCKIHSALYKIRNQQA